MGSALHPLAPTPAHFCLTCSRKLGFARFYLRRPPGDAQPEVACKLPQQGLVHFKHRTPNAVFWEHRSPLSPQVCNIPEIPKVPGLRDVADVSEVPDVQEVPDVGEILAVGERRNVHNVAIW